MNCDHVTTQVGFAAHISSWISCFRCMSALLRLSAAWVLCSLPAPTHAAEPSTAPSQSRSAVGTPSTPSLTHAWPSWRGPLADGTAPHATPPLHWSESSNILWRIPVPGEGHASPIAWSNAVYIVAASPTGEPRPPVYDKAPGTHDSRPMTHLHQFHVSAYDRHTGKQLWRTVLNESFPHEGGHVTGSLASNSPITDGQHLYVFLGSRGLFALDLAGRIVWQKNLGQMQTLHAHGEGSSPVLHQHQIIVAWDHEGESSILAFHKLTGEQLWKTARDEKTSWSTPLVIDQDGLSQVVVSATRFIRGYDLSTGRQLWQCAGLTDNVVSSPVYHQGLLISGNSYFTQAMLAIRLHGAQGDLTGSTNVVWSLRRMTPYVSSPLITHNTLYFLRHNQNILSRLDPLTGTPKAEALRLEGIRDFIFSSPVAAQNRLYITGRDGTTVVLDSHAESGNRTLAVNPLNDVFSATPALIENQLFLRGEKFLYCIQAR